MDDARLLRRAARGDRRAAGGLFDRYFDAVYRCALSFPGVDHHDAMDLAQETLLRAMENARSYDPSRPMCPWLRGIARNLLMTRRRRDARRSELGAQHLKDLLEDQSHTEARRRRDIAVVRREIAAMEDGPLKEVATRYYSDEEPTIDEVAGELGLPSGTVSARLSRLRRRLSTRLTALLLEER